MVVNSIVGWVMGMGGGGVWSCGSLLFYICVGMGWGGCGGFVGFFYF